MVSLSYIYIIFSSFITLLYCFITYIIYIILILCSIYKYFNLYKITKKNKLVCILNHVKYSHMQDDYNKPLGFIIGNNFIGFIENNNTECSAFILCNTKIYLNITKDILEDENDKIKTNITKDTVSIIKREGSFTYICYYSEEKYIKKLYETKNQSNIVNNIKEYYEKDICNVCIALIYGPPGSGKSVCALLLAKLYNSSYTSSYNPIEPGDTFRTLYNVAKPKKESPLIILLDEIDIIYENIANNTIQKHSNITTEIKDKRSYNNLFDEINLGHYPNIIIVMTSNLTFDLNNKTFHKYDQSFTREGRVHLYFNLEIDENNKIIIDKNNNTIINNETIIDNNKKID